MKFLPFLFFAAATQAAINFDGSTGAIFVNGSQTGITNSRYMTGFSTSRDKHATIDSWGLYDKTDVAANRSQFAMALDGATPNTEHRFTYHRDNGFVNTWEGNGGQTTLFKSFVWSLDYTNVILGGGMLLSRDGFSPATTGPAGYKTPSISASKVRVGVSFFAGSDLYWQGPIYEFALWNTQLTQRQCDLLTTSQMKRTPLQIRPDALLVYMPLDQLTVGAAPAYTNIFADLSANRRYGSSIGTLQGAGESILSYPPNE